MLFCPSLIRSVRFFHDDLFISRFRRDEHTATCWSHVDAVVVTVHVLHVLATRVLVTRYCELSCRDTCCLTVRSETYFAAWGERRSSAPLLGSHQASKLHCLGHICCRQTCCREQPSTFTFLVAAQFIPPAGMFVHFLQHSKHCTAQHQPCCFLLCLLTGGHVTLLVSFRHNCWEYLICNHIHSVPVVVPIFVIDVELFVNIISCASSHVVEVTSMSSMVAFHTSATSALNSTLSFSNLL